MLIKMPSRPESAKLVVFDAIPMARNSNTWRNRDDVRVLDSWDEMWA